MLKNIKINNNFYFIYISSSIIKEPGNTLLISYSLISAMSSLLKSYSIENSKKVFLQLTSHPVPSKQDELENL